MEENTPKEEPPKKKRFEVKIHQDEITGMTQRDIFIDDKLFEYEIDQDSLQKAKDMGGYYFVQAQKDIQKHFIESLSDFLGRKITAAHVMEAIQSGWI